MKTAISLPDELFHKAEAAAKARGVSRSELYAAALASFIAQYDSEEITGRLNQVYGDAKAEVDPVLSRMQFESLPPETW
jgi:metal-responsive CopG/Arc/MetJ family transcriptional regulator